MRASKKGSESVCRERRQYRIPHMKGCIGDDTCSERQGEREREWGREWGGEG